MSNLRQHKRDTGTIAPEGGWCGREMAWGAFVLSIAACALVIVTGCGPSYRMLRYDGLKLMSEQAYGPARVILMQADATDPQRIDNLYDIGLCSLMLAREQFEQRNSPAAFREADRAIAYFDRILTTMPAHDGANEGKNVALELKGQFDKALEHAEWVAEFVGPSAKHQVFLAQELEERGDVDGAYLRYRQAVAMEPENPVGEVALAKFLMRQNKESAALYHLQRAYRLDPLNRWVAEELIERNALPTDLRRIGDQAG